MMNLENSNINQFTKREKEIANLVKDGMTTTDISKALEIKINTVSTIKKKIFNMLEIKSSVELYKIFCNYPNLF